MKLGISGVPKIGAIPGMGGTRKSQKWPGGIAKMPKNMKIGLAMTGAGGGIGSTFGRKIGKGVGSSPLKKIRALAALGKMKGF